jgi:hypothetical protein
MNELTKALTKARINAKEKQDARTRLHAGIACWAAQLSKSAWKPGLPPQKNGNPYVAVKTETGRILVGKSRAFRPEWLDIVTCQGKYGRVIAYVVLNEKEEQNEQTV